MPVRFASLDVGPDRARALEVARALRAAGIRVEHTTGTTIVIRAEDRERAEAVVRALPER